MTYLTNSLLLAVLILCSNLICKAESLQIFTSIAPIEFLIEQNSGDLVEVETLLLPGQNPTNYQPTISKIKRLNQATIYFSVGLPFEQIIIEKLKKSNQSIKIIKLQDFVELRHFKTEHEHHEHNSGEHSCSSCGNSHGSSTVDPHIWLSPKNAINISQKIHTELLEQLPVHKNTLEENFIKLQTKLSEVDLEIKNKLKPFQNSLFFVYHPAFGYFADSYNLKQIAVETNGKSPTPKNLKYLINLAKEKKAKTIFIQEQFNSRSAEILAKAINAKVAKIDPLAKDYITNLQVIADTIAAGLE